MQMIFVSLFTVCDSLWNVERFESGELSNICYQLVVNTQLILLADKQPSDKKDK